MNWPNASFGMICSYIMNAAFSNEWATQYKSRVALQNKTMVLHYYCQTYYQMLLEARPQGVPTTVTLTTSVFGTQYIVTNIAIILFTTRMEAGPIQLWQHWSLRLASKKVDVVAVVDAPCEQAVTFGVHSWFSGVGISVTLLSFESGWPVRAVEGNFWWPGSDLSDPDWKQFQKNISDKLFLLETVIVARFYFSNWEIHKLIHDLVKGPRTSL